MGPKAHDIHRAASFAASAFENYAAELHRFLMRRLRQPQDAEDLAQEVFMRLSRIDNSEFVEKPRAYLFGIASHVVFEFRMRGRLKDWIVFDSGTVEAAAEQPAMPSTDELADRLDLQRQLTTALRRLPPLHLAVFLLHKRDGYSYDEIAERLDLSARQIENHITQARSLLRKMDWDR
jgi:RNA polymerase sigma factor (sigma-70 family)